MFSATPITTANPQSNVDMGLDPNFATRENSITELLAFSAPAVVAGFVDTVGNSVGLFDDNSVKDALQYVYKDFGDFYARNEDESKFVGDLAGMFLPGLGAMMAIRGGGMAYKATRMALGDNKFSSRLLNSVFTSGQQYSQLRDGISTAAFLAAKEGVNPIANTAVQVAMRNAYKTRMVDTIKETIAFEAAVFATMNESEVLYPSDMSTVDLLLLNTAPVAAFAGIEHLVMRRLFRNAAMSTASAAAAFNNPLGLDVATFYQSRAGARDVPLTANALTADAFAKLDGEGFKPVQQGISAELEAQAKANINKQYQAAQGVVNDQIHKLFADNPFGPKFMDSASAAKGFTSSSTATPAELNNIREILKGDAWAFFGTESFEHLPGSQKEIQSLLLKKRVAAEELRTQAAALDEVADELKIAELNRRADEIDSSELLVYDSYGYATPAVDYKMRWEDVAPRNKSGDKFEFETATMPTGSGLKITIGADPLNPLAGKQLVSADREFNVYIPDLLQRADDTQADSIIVNGQNLVQKVAPGAKADTSLIISDYAKDFHWSKGVKGRELFSSLSPRAKWLMEAWGEGPQNGGRSLWKAEWGDYISPRQMLESNHPAAAELNDSFKFFRERLRELADEDGTITLYRGEETQFMFSPKTNDVASYTPKLGIAQVFAKGNKHVIAKRVSVDDVMFIGSLKGVDEFELVVKNDRIRVAQPQDIINPKTGKKLFGDTVAMTVAQKNAGHKLLDELVNTRIRELTKSLDEGKRIFIPVPLQGNHMRLDATIEMIRRAPKLQNSLRIPGKPAGDPIDVLQMLSLQAKYEEFKKLVELVDQNAAKPGYFKLPQRDKLTLTDIEDMLNLPKLPDGRAHPITQMFYNLAKVEKQPTLPHNTLSSFKASAQHFFTKAGIANYAIGNMEVMGRQISNTANRKSIMAVKRPVSPSMHSVSQLNNTAAFSRAETMNKLAQADASGANFVGEIVRLIQENSATVAEARNVQLLMEGTMRGNNTVTTAAFRHADIGAIRAADALTTVVDRSMRQIVTGLFKQFDEVFTELRKPTARADMTSFNITSQLVSTFHIDKAVFSQEHGGYVYQLAKNNYNKKRLAKLGFADVDNIVYMPTATKLENTASGPRRQYKVHAASEKAHAGIEAVSALSTTAGRNASHLKETAGRGALTIRPVHIPPTNFLGKDLIYVLDNSGSVIDMVAGATPAQAMRRAEDVVKQLGAEDISATIVSQADVQRYYGLQDQALQKWYNFGDSMIQDGKKSGQSIAFDSLRDDENLLGDYLASINGQFESINRRTRAIIFENEINFARRMMTTDQAVTDQAAKQGKTVFQEYLRVIYGNPSLNPADNVGKVYGAVESWYDNTWRAIGDRFGAWKGYQADGDAMPWKNKQLEKIVADEYNPFSSVEDYLARTYKQSAPQSLRRHFGALNGITANLALRMFEVGHALLNLTSLAVTMPPVIKALARTGGETEQAWRARIGSFGLSFKDEAMFSPIRALTSGVHFMFTKEGQNWQKMASRRGYFDQDVVELLDTLIRPRQNYAQHLISKVTDKVSIISDSSERLARGIAFMTGLNIALKGTGLRNPDSVLVFAQRFADDVIGDFRPTNRPRIFQGALGMPLGLFQTFMVNYYQRLFNYAELGQKGAMFNQFAMQATVFGAQSVPGFQMLNEIYSNYDGTVNPVDTINNTFGQEVGELILYGSLANAPKMFGLDGTSIYTRSDMAIRAVPGVWSFDQTPVATLAKETFGVINGLISQARNGNVNSQGVAELLANYGLSRPFKNAMEIYSGVATDRRGQLIEDDTRTAFGIATRLVGLRPMQEARMAETFYRMSTTEMSQRAKMAEFREQMRSKMRSGSFTGEDFQRGVQNYIRYGGNPGNFGSWLADQAVIANVEKGHQQLIEAIRDPTRGYDVLRLMSVGNLPQNDPEFD